MPYAKLTLTVPKPIWIGKISRAHSETRFRVLAATANDSSGIAQLEIVGPDPETVCEEMRSYDAVTDLTVFEAEPELHRVQVETTVPMLLMAIEGSGVPLETPFEVQNGTMELEATLPQHRLSKLGDQLREFGISFSIDRIQQETESTDLLTDRQRWLLNEAISRGYYDTPREITLTELADELDIAASTCCEVLHRAEGSVLKEYIHEMPEVQNTTPVSAD